MKMKKEEHDDDDGVMMMMMMGMGTRTIALNEVNESNGKVCERKQASK